MTGSGRAELVEKNELEERKSDRGCLRRLGLEQDSKQTRHENVRGVVCWAKAAGSWGRVDGIVVLVEFDLV